MAEHAPIDRLSVENFQSIEKADVELGKFTVLVGRSNSGKSALLRALKAVVRNVNSPSAVRVGKSVFVAEITTNGHEISIERGKSQSTYRVIDLTGEEKVFAKSGRVVPDEIQALLGLPTPTGPDLVFSSQIDPPFLLDETGSVAAKVLGDLTNVSRLHDAVREANRRRKESSGLQRIREQDARSCLEAMQERFSDLPTQAAALKEARELLDSVKQQAKERDVLSSLLNDLEIAEAAEKDLLTRMESLPKPADIESLAEKAGALLGERQALLEILDSLLKLAEVEPQLESVRAASKAESEKAAEDYHAALVEAGQCPTCGSEIAA